MRRRRPAAGPLPRTFFERPVTTVARALLGRLLVYDGPGGRVAGRIVEVEAYGGPRDPASHAYRGRTARNAVMFEGPGRLYVYFTYGMHHCLNFVTRPIGVPQAVLVRALEPGPGVGRCGGPGLVCRALDIDRALNGVPLAPPNLYVVDDRAPRRRIVATPRIGIYNSGDWQERALRFCWDSPHLSRPIPKASSLPRKAEGRGGGS